VQWPTIVEEGRYRKDIDTTKAHPEDNWVWSLREAIDMHRPERWGIVQFVGAEAGAAPVSVDERPNRRGKQALRCLYYRQQTYHDENGEYAFSLSALGASSAFQGSGRSALSTLRTAQTMYEITAPVPTAPQCTSGRAGRYGRRRSRGGSCTGFGSPAQGGATNPQCMILMNAFCPSHDGLQANNPQSPSSDHGA